MTISGRATRVLALGGAALAFGLVACGDPVTAPHDWKATGSLSSHGGVSSGNIGYLVRNLRGPLLDGKGAPAPGTSFAEQCTAYASGFTTPEVCLVIVNTGTKVYVARGVSAVRLTFSGTFKTLDGKGTLTVSPIASNSQGPIEQVWVKARKLGV
jgi:hypothetical protein